MHEPIDDEDPVCQACLNWPEECDCYLEPGRAEDEAYSAGYLRGSELSRLYQKGYVRAVNAGTERVTFDRLEEARTAYQIVVVHPSPSDAVDAVAEGYVLVCLTNFRTCMWYPTYMAPHETYVSEKLNISLRDAEAVIKFMEQRKERT